jgi:hypothetical protein
MAISNLTQGNRPGICTSTTRPTAPYEGQMIFETDTDLVLVWSGSAWVEVSSMLTKAPRGVIAFTSSNSNTLSSEILTGLTTTFTAQTGRYYKISVSVYTSSTASADRLIIYVRTNGTTINRTADLTSANNLGYYNIASGFVVFNPSAGSQEITVRFEKQNGNPVPVAGGSLTHQLLIEDIGAA